MLQIAAACLSTLFIASEPVSMTEIPVPIRIVVLDAGAEPRQQVRYRLTAGEEFLQEQRIEMRSSSDGGPEVMAMSGMRRERITVTHVDEDSMRYDTVIEETRMESDLLSEPVREKMGDLRADETGLRHRTRVDAQGRHLIRGKTIPAALHEVQSRGLPVTDNAIGAIIFPSEPIGVGARWRIEPVGDGTEVGHCWIQTLRIDSITGDEVHLTIEADVSDRLPDMNIGTSRAETVESEGLLRADVVVRLTEPVPRRMSVNLKSKATTQFTFQGQEPTRTTRQMRAEVVSTLTRAVRPE